jgi:hypothetical protein
MILEVAAIAGKAEACINAPKGLTWNDVVA